MTKFHCIISTPESVIFDGQIESLTVPGHDGDVQILTDHMPIVVALKEGEIVYDKESYRITHGVAEVRADKKVIVLGVKAEEVPEVTMPEDENK